MRKVRIGNDINVRWEVKTDGQAVSLEGKALKLYVRSAYKKEEITTFTVEGCVVSFTYPASMQRMTGARAVILVDATEGAPRRTVCADQAFTLVAHTCEESDDDVEFENFMVSLQSNMLIGKPGMSAYEVWLSEGNTGTLADWYAYLQKPATDVAAKVTKAEAARVEAEKKREDGENARAEAETARQDAENGRDTAEQERAGNEDTRKTAEQSRNTAELDRRTDENIRTENESARMTEENKRIAAERQRAATFSALSADVDAIVGKANTAIEETDAAEALRVDAEAGRTRAEDERETNEQKRKLGETERKSAEMQREEVEESRVAAENSRVTAEKQRYDAEQERRQHENAREDSEGKRDTAERLRKQAETGRNNAEQERTASEQTRMENETQRETNERKREEAEDKREEAIVKFEKDFNEKLDLKTDLEQFNNTVSGINTNIATKANAQDVTNAIGELQDKIGDRVVVSGNVTNNPDEEDITTEGDTPQTQVLKLKDRAYDSLNASGKGYKILRKNWQPINGERKNVLTQAMINEPNTIYEIRYDFDLNGGTINIPNDCVLQFNGGCLKNGSVYSSGTSLSIYAAHFVKCSLQVNNCSLYVYSSNFDGENEKQYAIRCEGTKAYIDNVVIENYGNEQINNANGIWLVGDCSFSNILRSSINNIIAKTNASGIQFVISNKSDNLFKNCRIIDCTIQNIKGVDNDGDGIKFIGSDDEKYYLQYSNSLVQNCNFYNCSKRAIKVQAAGVKVKDIYIEGDCSFSFIDFQRAEAYAENIKCVGNTYYGISSSGIRNKVYLNNIQFDFDYKEDKLCLPIIVSLDNTFNNESLFKDKHIYINDVIIKKCTNKEYSAIKVENLNSEKITVDNLYINNILVYQSATYTPNISLRNINVKSAVITNAINKDTGVEFRVERINTTIDSLMSNVFYVRSKGFSCERNISGLFSSVKINITNIDGILIFRTNSNINNLINSPNVYNVIEVNDIIIGDNMILICNKKPDETNTLGLYHMVSLKNQEVNTNFKYLALTNKGHTVYNEQSTALNVYNGENYVDVYGYNAKFRKVGYSTSRPTIEINTNLGFQYYDTTLKKYIVWNGTEWTNMDGTSLGE